MIIVVGLILAFILVLIFSNRRTRQCRWREDRAKDHGNQKKYICMACGAEAFTTTSKPPLNCMTHLTPL